MCEPTSLDNNENNNNNNNNNTMARSLRSKLQLQVRRHSVLFYTVLLCIITRTVILRIAGDEDSLDMSTWHEKFPLLPNTDDDFSSVDMDFVHVITTRYEAKGSGVGRLLHLKMSVTDAHHTYTSFGQIQTNISSLCRARLTVFEHFCLNTVREQTNQNFLWIIRTPPNLKSSIKEPFLQSLQNQSNIVVLVAANDDESIRSPQFVVDDAMVWSGDADLLRMYQRLSMTRPLVETKLDPDDGLALDYVDSIQNLVIRDFVNASKTGTEDWKVWCVRSHVEWHPRNPFLGSKRRGRERETQVAPQFGFLMEQWIRDKFCVRTGLTYASGVSAGNVVGTTEHKKIATQLPQCQSTLAKHALPHEAKSWPSIATANTGSPRGQDATTSQRRQVRCWQFVYEDGQGTVRTRTPTSAAAGASDLNATRMETLSMDKTLPMSPAQKTMWEEFWRRFGVGPHQAEESRLRFLSK